MYIYIYMYMYIYIYVYIESVMLSVYIYIYTHIHTNYYTRYTAYRTGRSYALFHMNIPGFQALWPWSKSRKTTCPEP